MVCIETTLASHLAKSKQDACAYKILQDGRFGKIEQEHLARSCKYLQNPSYARLSKMMLARYCKNEQDRSLARLSKISWQD